ncbi:MAG: type II secretion system F family protein [Candidatus Moraniibacteriota bacterium]|nr:MAG: type II secretion system F family protein [Candidatus Moranbacteria bacterium]
MPKYLFTAKNLKTGEAKGGELSAKDEKGVASSLASEGFVPTSIKMIDEAPAGVSVKFFDRFSTVPLKEKMVFTRNLAVMVSSGLSLSRAIQNLSSQTKNKRFKAVLESVQADLQTGKTLSEGMSRFPTIFNELFVNMIYVGEVSGNLEMVLDILATQLEKEHDITSKVKGALIYPAVILVAMIGIAILMLTYILPSIVGVFKDMDVKLPAMTVFIMSLSDFLRHHFIASGVIVLALLVGGKVFLATKTGKRAFSFFLLFMPIVGNIVVKVNCARFARIYSSLLKSGVSVVDGLGIVSRVLSNDAYKKALVSAISEIQRGTELSVVILRYPKIFPLLVPQMIAVGEETGKTETVLEKLATFYEDEVTQITKNMSSIIEPILMLLIGGGVGFFAVAMLQPMYSVLENIK